jgi:hypothetical protein
VPDFLGIVQQYTESEIADKAWKEVPKPDPATIRNVVNEIEANTMPRFAKDLLWALKIRAGYESTQGDVTMMEKYLVALFDRFSKGQPPDLEKTFLVRDIPLVVDVPELTEDNFMLIAVDFHVSKSLVSDLNNAMLFVEDSEQLDEDFGDDDFGFEEGDEGNGKKIEEDPKERRIRKVMWIASSGVQGRLLAKDWKDGSWVEPKPYEIPENVARYWAKLEKDLFSLAKQTLDARRVEDYSPISDKRHIKLANHILR